MYKLVETQSNAPSYTLMKAGVNENVSLVDVTFDTLRKDGTGGNVIRFYFQDEDGAKFTQTYMEVASLERLKESAKNAAQSGRPWSSTPEQLHSDLLRNVGESLYHILSAFVPKDKVSRKKEIKLIAQRVIDKQGLLKKKVTLHTADAVLIGMFGVLKTALDNMNLKDKIDALIKLKRRDK